MKNYSNLLWTLLGGSMICCSMALTSCEKDDDNEGNGTINTDIPDNPKTGNMTANEQKAKLDKAGQALADELNASELKYICNLSEYVGDELCDYEGSAVTEWFYDLVEQMTTDLGTNEFQTSYEGGNYKDYATYHTSNSKLLIVLSNFTGHFTAENGKWSYAKANDLQFNFKDQQGKSCNLTLKTSGKTYDLDYGTNISEDWNWTSRDSIGWSDYYQQYINYTIYESDTYIDSVFQVIRVPENVELTLTQAGKTTAQLKYSFDLSKLNEDTDISNLSVSGTATMQIADYIIKVEKAAFDSNKEAAISYSFSKGSKTLLAWSAEVTGNVADEDLKTVKLVFDIMGEVQIKGKISDGNSFVKYINKANENNHNEAKYKSNISLANDLMNLGIYYNGSDVRQAKIALECFSMRDRWGDEDAWDCEPVIYFGDATSYSTFDAFFSEGFDKLVAKFEKILDDLNDL